MALLPQNQYMRCALVSVVAITCFAVEPVQGAQFDLTSTLKPDDTRGPLYSSANTRNLHHKGILFDETSLNVTKNLLDASGFSFNLSIQFETYGIGAELSILDSFEFVIDASVQSKKKRERKYEDEIQGPIELVSDCFIRSKHSQQALGYDKVYPLNTSLPDALRIFGPKIKFDKSDPRENFSGDEEDEDKPFDWTLLSHITVLICEDSTIPCDSQSANVIVVKESDHSQRSSDDAKGPYLELGKYETEYLAHWDIDDYPFLHLKDLRMDIYVEDMFIDTMSFPVIKWKNIKSPLEFAISSNAAVRTHVLMKHGYSAYAIATHLMCEFYSSPKLVMALLFQEGFTAEDVAKVLKMALNISANDFALFGISVESMDALYVKEGLMSCAFGLNDTAADTMIAWAGADDLIMPDKKKKKRHDLMTYADEILERLIETDYAASLKKTKYLQFDRSTLNVILSPEIASRSDSFRYNLFISFHAVGFSKKYLSEKYQPPSVDDILTNFRFFFEAKMINERHKTPSYGEGTISPVPICLARARDPDGSFSTDIDDVYPLDVSLPDALRIFGPKIKFDKSDPRENFSGDEEDEDKPFDWTLLSHITVLICEDSTIPCNSSDTSESVIVVKEFEDSIATNSMSPLDSLMVDARYLESPDDAKGPYLELGKYETEYLAHWDIDDYPFLHLKDLRMDIYVEDMFIDTMSFPISKGKDIKSPLEFAISSNAAVRTRVLRTQGLPAFTIATHLMCEFFAKAELVVSLLLSEGFGAEDVARSSKLLYEVTKEDYARFGGTLGMSSYFVAFGLKDKCAFDVSDFKIAAKLLRDGGYSAADNYEALKIVYGVGIYDIEDVLLSLGYSEDDLSLALMPDLLVIYKQLIEEHGPRVYYHPSEQYLMSSIDWYLEHEFLGQKMKMHYTMEKRAADDPPPPVFVHDDPLSRNNLYEIEQSLLANGAEKIWMQYEGMKSYATPNGTLPAFDDNFLLSPGNNTSAKAYVKAVRIKQSREVDLTFHLWYPYNGAGTTRVQATVDGSLAVGETNFETGGIAGNVEPIGEHPTDWEQIVLRFDEHGMLLSLTTSAHGAFSQSDPMELSYVGSSPTIPKVYTAFNGHALFPNEGDNWHTEVLVDEDVIQERPFTLYLDAAIETANFCKESSVYLESSKAYEIYAVDKFYLNTEGQVDDSSWAAFSGKWGSDTDDGDYDRKELLGSIIEGGNIYGKIYELVLKGCAVYVAAAFAIPVAGVFLGPAAAIACAAAISILGPVFLIDVFYDNYAIQWAAFYFDLFGGDGEFDETVVSIDKEFRALGTSKNGPGLYRKYTNQWLGAINENPGFIRIEEKATFVSGSDIELTVITHDKFLKEKKFNDYVSQGPTQTLYAYDGAASDEATVLKPKYGDKNSFSVIEYGINASRVELVVDNFKYGGTLEEVLQISVDAPNETKLFGPVSCASGTCTLFNASIAANVLQSIYKFSWDSTGYENGQYTLTARAIGYDKRSYTYPFSPSTKEVTACNGDCNYIEPIGVSPRSSRISEGGSIFLDVDFKVACMGNNGACNANVTVNWGDGSISQVSYVDGLNAYNGSHVYAQDGTYSIEFIITSNQVESESVTVYVENVAPTIGAIEASLPSSMAPLSGPVAASDYIVLSTTFQDPGVEDSHNVIGHWGDGSMFRIMSVSDASSGITKMSMHSYSSNGIYDLSVKVEDSSGASSAEKYLTIVAYETNDFAASGLISYPIYNITTTTNATTNETDILYGVIGYGNATVHAFVSNGASPEGDVRFSAGAFRYESSTIEEVDTSGGDDLLVARGSGMFFGGDPNLNGQLFAFESIFTDDPSASEDDFALKVFNTTYANNPFNDDDAELLLLVENSTFLSGAITKGTRRALRGSL